MQTFFREDSVALGTMSSGNPTFVGVETRTYSSEADDSIQGTLDQEGTYSGGSFALATVTYSGGSSASFTSSEELDSAWTGDYSGSQTHTYSDSGSNSFAASAAGNFAAGSFSMSSLVLQASATRSTSTSDNYQASTLGQSATYDQFQGYDDSASVYQAGTMSAGSFANTSYTYHQSGLSTFATDVDAAGLAGSQTWTQSTSADVVLGSNPAKFSSSAFAFDTGAGVTTFSNNGNTSTDGPIGEALFKFTAPDNNLVPMAGAAPRGRDWLVGRWRRREQLPPQSAHRGRAQVQPDSGQELRDLDLAETRTQNL